VVLVVLEVLVAMLLAEALALVMSVAAPATAVAAVGDQDPWDYQEVEVVVVAPQWSCSTVM
jgi:hypothetical protein